MARSSSLVLVGLLVGCGTSDPGNDRDDDGVAAARDCDDRDADRFPGNTDTVGDGVDNDCDGVDGVDADGDGEPSAASGGRDCDDLDPATLGEDFDGDGWPECVDCHDGDPGKNPGMAEVCDDVDQDCDEVIDVDLDGVGVCELSFAGGSAVDALFVIDNSCSMAEEQALLGASAHALTDVWLNSGLDYRVGVITTDMNDLAQAGRLQPYEGHLWVEPSTPNRDQVLNEMILQGTGGSADERGTDAVYTALEVLGATANQGFARDLSALDIIVLSDEDDHSDISWGDFQSWLLGHRQGQVRFHAIVSPNPICPTGAEPGDSYSYFATLTDGVEWSICDGDYQAALYDIASLHDPSGEAVFELPVAVDPATLAADVLDGSGAVTVAYGAAELVWDPAALTVTLPEPVPTGGGLLLRYAPLD